MLARKQTNQTKKKLFSANLGLQKIAVTAPPKFASVHKISPQSRALFLSHDWIDPTQVQRTAINKLKIKKVTAVKKLRPQKIPQKLHPNFQARDFSVKFR